jgi:PHD/YefM family antitoxin component YafN of YafNO toxin-antitoxin module
MLVNLRTQSLNDLRSNPDDVIALMRRYGKPLLLTEDGKPEVMLIDARKLHKKFAVRRIERMIAEAEEDVAAGRVEDFDKFMARFRNEHNL